MSRSCTGTALSPAPNCGPLCGAADDRRRSRPAAPQDPARRRAGPAARPHRRRHHDGARHHERPDQASGDGASEAPQSAVSGGHLRLHAAGEDQPQRLQLHQPARAWPARWPTNSAGRKFVVGTVANTTSSYRGVAAVVSGPPASRRPSASSGNVPGSDYFQDGRTDASVDVILTGDYKELAAADRVDQTPGKLSCPRESRRIADDAKWPVIPTATPDSPSRTRSGRAGARRTWLRHPTG